MHYSAKYSPDIPSIIEHCIVPLTGIVYILGRERGEKLFVALEIIFLSFKN